MTETTKKNEKHQQPLACVILAAGLGTRMKSDVSKVLHQVAGRSLLAHVIAACEAVGAEKIIVVASPANSAALAPVAGAHQIVIQEKPLGTGDALKAAQKALAGFDGAILVASGDAPLMSAQSLSLLVHERHKVNAAVAAGGFYAADPAAYGRFLTNDTNQLLAIVEAKDASPEQLKITFCGSSTYAFDGAVLWGLLDKIKNENAKQEYYLTDVVALARGAGRSCVAVALPEEDALGINTRVELATVEKVMQKRLAQAAMLGGVTMQDPASVYLSFDTRFGHDVTVEPNVYFSTGVTIGDHVQIRAFSHLEGATVAAHAQIGPYARLRPGAVIEAEAHIGNFVEIKKSTVATGAKVNHLTYIGDATIGPRSNIGAGTITCNYDGYTKSQTTIGADVFVGSNTALVAPVTIGDGALIAAGSTITQDVPEGALAFGRSRQARLDGAAARFREAAKAKKGK